jgi:hypothetical protein
LPFLCVSIVFDMSFTTIFSFIVLITIESQVTCQSKNELFSFEKLSQYTSLASCFALIHEDFAYCNKKAEEKGKSYLEGIDLNSEWATRVKCCGTWKLRDCWVRAAAKKCTDNQTEQVSRLPYTFMPKVSELCAQYPPNSSKCSFPVLLVSLVSLSLVSLIAAIIVFFVVRRRRRRQLLQQQLQSQCLPSAFNANNKKKSSNGSGINGPVPQLITTPETEKMQKSGNEQHV